MKQLLILALILSGCTKASISKNKSHPIVEKSNTGKVSLTTFGERSKNCTSLKDSTSFTIPQALKTEALGLLDNDKLNQVVIQGTSCLRVGTEVVLEQSDEPVSYLGKVFIKQIDELSGDNIQKNLGTSSYDQISIDLLISQSEDKKISMIYFDMIEKVVPTHLTEDSDRLPSCYKANRDWWRFEIKKEGWEEQLKKLNDGDITAEIWAGSQNCYRIGKKIKILIEDAEEDIDHGTLVVEELFLVHHSELNTTHAKLVKEDLHALKTRIEKDKNGGYTTMWVFRYEKPELTTEPNP